MSKASVLSPLLVASLLRRFKGDLVSPDELSMVEVARFGGLFSSSAGNTTPLLSRHVGHNLTKREMSSFGTLRSQNAVVRNALVQYHEYTFLT